MLNDYLVFVSDHDQMRNCKEFHDFLNYFQETTLLQQKIDHYKQTINSSLSETQELSPQDSEKKSYYNTFSATWNAIYRLYNSRFEYENQDEKVCLELQTLFDQLPEAVLFYLPQLCHFFIFCIETPSKTIENFILHNCANCVQFALIVHLYLETLEHVHKKDATYFNKCLRLKLLVNSYYITSKRPSEKNTDYLSRLSTKIAKEDLSVFSDLSDFSIPSPDLPVKHHPMLQKKVRSFASWMDDDRKSRLDFLQAEVDLIHSLNTISAKLLTVLPEQRNELLKKRLEKLNSTMRFPMQICLPYVGNIEHIFSIPSNEGVVFNTKTKAPFLICIEYCSKTEKSNNNRKSKRPTEHRANSCINVKSALKSEKFLDQVKKPQPSTTTTEVTDFVDAFGENWSLKKERIRNSSRFGFLPNWRLTSVIVKTGDNLWQDMFTLQLIKQMQMIWSEAGLPHKLITYNVLATSHDSGIIETLMDAISLHSLKKNTPNFTNLPNYFQQKFGQSPEKLQTACYNFADSLAAYSIVCYLLQIKDRHNGNIMLDKDGHIIHIDFGFILGINPGNLNFEAAFKLTQEMVDVLNLQKGLYDYFCHLFICGFLQLQKHSHKIVTMVEIMSKGSFLACFVDGGNVVEDLRERFKLSLTPDECVSYVQSLVLQNLNNSRTVLYDSFQQLTNGILP
eukprot:TRINITY_DN3637_c0_g1_i2.p1 TRINITY_DN3637_c0_g1~~TRINITY_DN3637_c0_g1_i2.p1  ORF type:complete len:678 (-),score=101.27 TRINITY_DN3637_c0_g1_i2:84-2117(-)